MTEAETDTDDESARAALVSAAARVWQRELAALGGPNSLLWDSGNASEQRLDLTNAHPAGMARLLSSGSVRLSELFREPAARARVLEQARGVAHLAARLYDDFGLASCYLSAGTASWSWSGADRAPRSAVLLRACTLRPVADDLHLVVSDRVEVNPVLVATLTALGVTLDTRAVLKAVTVGTNFDPRAAYDAVRGACAQLMDFRIEQQLLVGVFSHYKLPLMRDLPDQARTLPAGHVVAAFAGDAGEMDEVAAAPSDYVEHDPRQEWLAVDLDSAQQDVVDAAVEGANLCVLGAAGTGKTHTVAGLIATLAAQGRRVLFVAHARATVDAVQEHLAAAGIPDVMLDLGRDDRTPSEVLHDLHDILQAATASAGRVPAPDADIAALRARVQQHYVLMHEPLEPWGVTLDAAQDRLTQLSRRTTPPRSRVRLAGETLAAINDRRRLDLQDQLTSVVANGAWSTTGETDAWFGARLIGTQQADRARDLVRRLAHDGLQTHRQRWSELCVDLGLAPPPTTVVAEEQLLDLLRGVHQTLEIFAPQIFDAPLDDMVVATAGRRERSGVDHRIGTLDRRRLDRQARSLLRPGVPPRDLQAVLIRARAQRQEWRDAAGPGARPATRSSVPDLARHTELLRGELEWLGGRLIETLGGGDLLETDYDQLQERLRLLDSQPERLQAAADSLATLDTLRGFGLDALLADLAARHVDGSGAARELEFVWWASIVDHIATTVPAYQETTGEQERSAAHAYADADHRHRSLSAVRLRATIAAQRAGAERDLPEQVGVLQRHVGPVGELLPLAPELTTALAPCWAMSPLAVPAQLPSGLWFDVVIVDDSSAVWTSHAIPAITRGAQLVVFGDPMGVAPMPFPTGPDTGHGDVLLDRARQLFPIRTLDTHYRSLDERLFGFAAARVYANEVATFPSARPSGALRLDMVSDARYDQGTSPAEVERVVQVLLDQARSRPHESVSVLAFDTRHADRIAAELRAVAAKDDVAAGLLTVPTLISTADRALGMTRDAVIVATGFGRDLRGRVPQRLGAVSEAGGERLVTCAMTRASHRVVVVSGVDGDDLDPTTLRSRGALLLRDYLLYAASGGSSRRITSGGGAAPAASGRRRRTASTGSVLDAPLTQQPSTTGPAAIADFARRLTVEGMVVHTAHGLGGPRIDLVVEDPRRRGELLLAIETDGAVYAELAYARDRERIRPEQLRSRGWAYERVLTRDLFRDPAKEVARVVHAVHAASVRRNAVPALSPSTTGDQARR